MMDGEVLEFIFYVGFFILMAILIFLIYIAMDYSRNPFSFLQVSYIIDISGRKSPSYSDCIDQWIIDHQGFNATLAFQKALDEWDSSCNYILQNSYFWKRRKLEFYEEMRLSILQADYKPFAFVFNRNQTRYRQVNYQKIPYVVDNTIDTVAFTVNELCAIDQELEMLDYSITREKYHSKNQRKLMTRDLRVQIMNRDSYTCQCCGKQMLDEVGLHIDHIVPIRLGGKSIVSNLQVLCDKCNLKKGSK